MYPLRLILPLCLVALSLIGFSVDPPRSAAKGERSEFPSLALGASQADWLIPWTHRVSLTVSPDSIAEGATLVDFPVLITLTDAHPTVFAGAKADGSDLQITAGDGVTPLAREIVSFDPVGKSAEIWFQADVLSPSNNEFFLYYGNPSVSLPEADGSVWNDRYLGVYHFSEDPGNQVLADFSPRENHALPGNQSIWTSSDVGPGQIGQAWAFDGVTHSIFAGAISTPDTSYVVSSWTKLTTRSTDFAFHSNPQYWHVSFQTNDVQQRPHFGAANPWRDLRWDPNPIPLGDYHYYTWVFDGEADTILFYFDGEIQPATPWALEAGVEHFYTGIPINPAGNEGVGFAGPMYWNNLDILDGGCDEFRVSERTKTGAWIKTEYRNQSSPQGFLSVGSEETTGPVSVPLVLLSFVAEREETRARIRWEIASSSYTHAGFHLYRETFGAGLVRITQEPLLESQFYEVVDEEAPSGEAVYRLAELTRGAEEVWLGSTRLAAGSDPGRVFMLSAPNPLRQSASLGMSLPSEGQVLLQMFDASGREVARLLDGVLPQGNHEVQWQGRGRDNRPVPPGVYFFRLMTREGKLTRRVVVLR